MSWSRPPLDLSRLRVYPLAERRSLSTVEEILVDPGAPPPPLEASTAAMVEEAAARIRQRVAAGPR